MKTRPLPWETRARILEAAWAHVLERGRVDISIAEIAREAGVTRQSVYLAFGGRTGLMIAMARHADDRSVHSHRLRAIAAGDDAGPEALMDYVEAWLRHLPEIYPVGVLLGAAAITDPEAAAVFNDRMVGSLHARYRSVLGRLAAAGHLARRYTPDAAADLAWSLTHIDAWRHLVVERGWTPEAFRADRAAIIRSTLLAPPAAGAG
jgi:AcrR family transcriptional regulator